MESASLLDPEGLDGLLSPTPQASIALPVVGQPEYLPLSRWLTKLVAADLLGATVAAASVFRIYADPLGYVRWQLWCGVAGFLISWTLSAYVESLYSKRMLLSGLRDQSITVAACWAMSFGILLLIGFSLQVIGTVSRVWLLTWAFSVLCWVSLIRLAWCLYVRRMLDHGTCFDRALVVAGSVEKARAAGEEIRTESGGRIGIVSAIGFPMADGGPPIAWVENAVKNGSVDRIIISNIGGSVEQARSLIQHVMRVAVDVTFIPDIQGLDARIVGVDRIGLLPTVELVSRPLSALEAVLKRTEDLILAATLLIATAPLFAIIALAIKIESAGPVFFHQVREGHHDRAFEIWKFRTMYADRSDFTSVQQTSRSDSRVTRVGVLLRRLSLDELPQLFNVIRGEMSVVGPRPHALGMTSRGLRMTEVMNDYPARHRLKPGITGWAQVNHCRGEIDSHEKLRRRVALDCFYIDNWSIWLDLWIVLRTAGMIFISSDAY